MASPSPKKKMGRPPTQRVGRTVAGMDYLTTHACPGCDALLETVGAGYPQLICGKCRMQMVAKPKKVEKP